jgi:hypothetical protein
MRAAPVALLWLVFGACSASLDGDHFRADPAEPDGGAPHGIDARAPGRAPDHECVAPTDTCKPECEDDDCLIDCRHASTCEPRCKQATCDIDCTDALACDHVKCEEDSECLLDCTGAERCGFEKCDGEVTTCPGGVLACNRECP